MNAPDSAQTPQVPSDKRSPSESYNPWPASIIATFILFIGGTVGLVVLASKDRNDLVSADYYEQEIRYQRRIDQLHRTEPFSDEIKASFDADSRRLVLTLPSKHATSGVTGEIQLYRPNQAGADRTLPIAANSAGLQYLPTDDLKPGLWKVRFQWTVGTEEYFADRQIVIPTRSQPASRLD